MKMALHSLHASCISYSSLFITLKLLKHGICASAGGPSLSPLAGMSHWLSVSQFADTRHPGKDMQEIVGHLEEGVGRPQIHLSLQEVDLEWGQGTAFQLAWV